MTRSAQLTQVLAEFAHTLGTDFSIRRTLDHLVDRIRWAQLSDEHALERGQDRTFGPAG